MGTQPGPEEKLAVNKANARYFSQARELLVSLIKLKRQWDILGLRKARRFPRARQAQSNFPNYPTKARARRQIPGSAQYPKILSPFQLQLEKYWCNERLCSQNGFESRRFFEISVVSCKQLEVERAWARAQKPGPNFRLPVNKPQARGWFFEKLNVGSTSKFPVFINEKFGLDGIFHTLGLVRARP